MEFDKKTIRGAGLYLVNMDFSKKTNMTLRLDYYVSKQFEFNLKIPKLVLKPIKTYNRDDFIFETMPYHSQR